MYSLLSWLVKAEHSGHIIQASEPQLIIDQINLVLKKTNLYK
ncbi:hypothetical protein [Pedobacter duraquae]|uniref:Uncharacterized protein n=1 Tax=Pedobacter duraquae TaxID=425511 RepID=A0A4R6IPT4_9SPHI|nr:hypothetical protein [Pedobacter duraquae]TDO24197.1 hypothetical protein CLV32_0486 [Pedobacter duraquae]